MPGPPVSSSYLLSLHSRSRATLLLALRADRGPGGECVWAASTVARMPQEESAAAPGNSSERAGCKGERKMDTLKPKPKPLFPMPVAVGILSCAVGVVLGFFSRPQ